MKPFAVSSAAPFAFVLSAALLFFILPGAPAKAQPYSQPYAQGNAQPLITPFGNLQWDDSFTSTAQKILAIPGVEKCQAGFFLRETAIQKRDALSLSRIPAQLLKMNPEPPLTFAPLPGYKEEVFSEIRTGRQYRYVSGGECKITAFPVMLCNVPFALTATFELNPGLLLYKPTNSLLTADNLLLPFVLKRVRLQSDSRALALQAPAISQVISAKYFGGRLSNGTSLQKDSAGTYLTVNTSQSQYSIEYGASSGSGYSQYLRKAYNNYLNQLALRSNQGKKDLSSGL